MTRSAQVLIASWLVVSGQVLIGVSISGLIGTCAFQPNVYQDKRLLLKGLTRKIFNLVHKILIII